MPLQYVPNYCTVENDITFNFEVKIKSDHVITHANYPSGYKYTPSKTLKEINFVNKTKTIKKGTNKNLIQRAIKI